MNANAPTNKYRPELKPAYIVWNTETGDLIHSYYTQAAAKAAATRLNKLAETTELYRADRIELA